MSFVDFFNLTPATPSMKAQPRESRLVAYMLLLFVLTALTAVKQGAVKPLADIDWVDVIGEGATLLAGAAWLHFIIAWRPPGPVTRWLAFGFSLLAYGFFLDALDELVRFNNTLWGQSLESVVTPVAIAVLTFAAVALHNEQRVLHRQQHRREAHYRDHQAIDAITDLYNANYCLQVLNAGIQSGQPPVLWLIDLQNFEVINQRHGFAAGDTVLNRVANTLVATVPRDSLVCRYAGDRFVVLTHQRGISLALEQSLGQLLGCAMRLALYDCTGVDETLAVRVVALEPMEDEAAEKLLQRANNLLQARK